MSASFTVGQSNEFDKLLALAMFVQTPEYHERVKELRDLETRTRAALDQSTTQIAANDGVLRQIRDERQKHIAEVQIFEASGAHQRADLARRERDLQINFAKITKREAELAAEQSRHDAAVETTRKALATQADQLSKREEAVKFREDRLTQEQAAFNLRRDRIEKAYRGD